MTYEFQRLDTKQSWSESLQVYIEMQMASIAKCYDAEKAIEVSLLREHGEYRAAIYFSCKDFSFTVRSRSWSPYQSLLICTSLARDQIMSRVYDQITYA